MKVYEAYSTLEGVNGCITRNTLNNKYRFVLNGEECIFELLDGNNLVRYRYLFTLKEAKDMFFGIKKTEWTIVEVPSDIYNNRHKVLAKIKYLDQRFKEKKHVRA